MKHSIFTLCCLVFVSCGNFLTAQSAVYWFPDHFKLSEDKILEGFECKNGKTLIMGGAPAFFGILEDSQVLELVFFDHDDYAVFDEGYETDSSYVFVGHNRGSDVLDDLEIKWLEVSKDGDILHEAHANTYDGIVEGGLIDGADSFDIVVSFNDIFEVRDTALVSVYQHGLSGIKAAAGVGENVYFGIEDSLYRYHDSSIEAVGSFDDIKRIMADGSGGIYVITSRQIWYSSDVINNPNFRIISNHRNDQLAIGGNNIRLGELSDTIWVSTNKLSPGRKIETRVLSFIHGSPVDTLDLTAAHYQWNDVVLGGGEPIGIGSQKCCGNFSIDGLCFPYSKDTTFSLDLSIDLKIISSYWTYDTMPMSNHIFKTHLWRYEVEIRNEGEDTINDHILFEPQDISVFSFQFRDKYKVSTPLPPGETWVFTGRGMAFRHDLEVKTYCLSVDLPNGSLDRDYSNNSACADIPNPKPSSVDSKNSSFRIYPNPADRQIFIETDENIEKVEVLSLSGIVARTEVESRVIDISGLASGIYYLRIRIENEMITQRILVR